MNGFSCTFVNHSIDFFNTFDFMGGFIYNLSKFPFEETFMREQCDSNGPNAF
jgi:hypothetical protein